jgi:hypothetical protein
VDNLTRVVIRVLVSGLGIKRFVARMSVRAKQLSPAALSFNEAYVVNSLCRFLRYD